MHPPKSSLPRFRISFAHLALLNLIRSFLAPKLLGGTFSGNIFQNPGLPKKGRRCVLGNFQKPVADRTEQTSHGVSGWVLGSKGFRAWQNHRERSWPQKMLLRHWGCLGLVVRGDPRHFACAALFAGGVRNFCSGKLGLGRIHVQSLYDTACAEK